MYASESKGGYSVTLTLSISDTYRFGRCSKVSKLQRHFQCMQTPGIPVTAGTCNQTQADTNWHRNRSRCKHAHKRTLAVLQQLFGRQYQLVRAY